MPDLQAFESSLRNVIGDLPDARPFVCSGSPFECEFAVVGFNPATGLTDGFWRFWDDSFGFRREDWFRAYMEERRAYARKEGKREPKGPTKTRTRIELLERAASPRKLLMTNLYAVPSESEKSLPRAYQTPRVLEFLLSTLPIKSILVFGNRAKDHLSEIASQRFEDWQPTQVKLLGSAISIVTTPHFRLNDKHGRKGWTNEHAEYWGRRLAKSLID